MSVTIRKERPEDIGPIRAVNDKAFGQPQEGRLVDLLRENGGVVLSLVAIVNDRVVGHILYSPVSVDADGKRTSGAGLGPVAVLPEHQRQGIGSRLITTGNRTLRGDGCPFVVVLGHPEYYPRFGFERASSYGVTCEWEVPDGAFMILVLDERAVTGISGVATYRQEFSSVT